jgi:hypothetical protein
MRINHRSNGGSTLVVTITVVATLLVLLGVAVNYSTQISRTTQRSRKTAVAMEIADGHLEYLFSNWRNIYRTTWTTTYGSNTGGTDYSVVGTNYFYTTCPSCSPTPSGPAPAPVQNMNPSGTPPAIPLPPTSNFPTEANYTVNQYRIQAVDPMVDLDASGNALVETSNGSNSYTAMNAAATPPAGYGPNPAYGYNFPYSYYYLASVDVTVPALTGTVTAKVRRVFEKKFDLPWSFLMFYVDDLELQPSAALTIDGPIHTNSSLYIGTTNFTTSSRVEYGSNYVNGYSPNDSRYGGSVTSPNFAKSDASLALSDCPPYQTSPYLPFGWNLTFSLTTNANDGYREIIEQPAANPDPLASVRMYNQAGLRIQIDSAGNITGSTVNYGTTPATVTALSGGALTTIKNFVSTGTAASSTLSSSYVFYDNRETGYMKATNVDVYQLAKAVKAGSIASWNGVVYISDVSALMYNTDGTPRSSPTPTPAPVNVTYNGTTYSTQKRAIRLINGAVLPAGGLTIVTDNPVYIVGDYNVYAYPTGSTTVPSSYPAATPPSDNGTYTTRILTGTSGTQPPYSAVMGDAITVLSKNWVDTNSTGPVTSSSRWGYNTTINSCLVAGSAPSSGGVYGGGGENFIRFLEDWSHNNNTFTFYGSMVQLFKPQQSIGAWSGSGNLYKAPALKWYYDDDLLSDGAPPGNLDIAAYLQQQRWYQVY